MEIHGAILQRNYSSQKNVSEYIDQELAKVGIIYKKEY